MKSFDTLGIFKSLYHDLMASMESLVRSSLQVTSSRSQQPCLARVAGRFRGTELFSGVSWCYVEFIGVPLTKWFQYISYLMILMRFHGKIRKTPWHLMLFEVDFPVLRSWWWWFERRIGPLEKLGATKEEIADQMMQRVSVCPDMEHGRLFSILCCHSDFYQKQVIVGFPISKES